MESPDAVGERFRAADDPAARAAALGVDLPLAMRASARFRRGLIIIFAPVAVAVIFVNGVGGDAVASTLPLVLTFVAFVAVVLVVAAVRASFGEKLSSRLGGPGFQILAAVVLITAVTAAARLAAVLWPGTVSVMVGAVLAASLALAIDAVSMVSLPSLIARGHPAAVEAVRSLGGDIATVTTLGGRWKMLLADTVGTMAIGALLAYAAWSSVGAAIVAMFVTIAANVGAISAHKYAGTQAGLILTWLTVAAVAAVAALL